MREITPKEFWEIMHDMRFLRTGWNTGIIMGEEVVCPDWTKVYELFRITEAIEKIEKMLR